MAFNLYIAGSVPTWDEFGAQAHDRLIEVKNQLTISKGFLDPLTGLFSAMPLYVPADDDGNWTFSNSADWITPKSSFENRKTVQYHQDTDTNWTATRSVSLAQGQGFSLYWNIVEYAGASNDSLQITFGGVWRLIFTENATVELLKYEGASYVTQDFFENPFETLFDHCRLLVYQVGPTLVVKNWADLEGGFKYLDPDPILDGDGLEVCLRAGTVAVQGTARCYLGFRSLKWEQTVTATRAQVGLLTTSTQDETASYEGWDAPDSTVTLTVYDQDGNEWDPDTYPDPTAFYWKLEMDNSGDDTQTSFVGTVHVIIPRTLTSTGLTAADLGSIAAVQHVEWVESLDPRQCTLTATVKDTASLSTYIEPDQRLDWVLNSTTLFTGLLEAPERVGIGKNLEGLQLRANAARRLDVGTIWGLNSQDDVAIETALSNVIQSAAIASGDITVATIGYTLPSADPDEDPKFLPGPGDSPGRFLDYILESVAADYYWKPKPNFQYEVLLRTTVGGSVATFYTTRAAAVSAGKPLQVVRRYEERYEPEGYANVVIVVGQKKDGTPLFSGQINWTDIRTRAPYLPIILLIIDESLRAQATVNWVCRQSYERVIVKRVRASWEGGYVAAAGPGSTVTIGSNTYRVLNRVTRYDKMLERTGWTSYDCEKL